MSSKIKSRQQETQGNQNNVILLTSNIFLAVTKLEASFVPTSQHYLSQILL